MKPWSLLAVCATAVLSAACSHLPNPRQDDLTIHVVSGPPEYVSGGSARIEVRAPTPTLSGLGMRLDGSPER